MGKGRPRGRSRQKGGGARGRRAGKKEDPHRQGIDGNSGPDDLRPPQDDSPALRAKPKRRGSVGRGNVGSSTKQVRQLILAVRALRAKSTRLGSVGRGNARGITGQLRQSSPALRAKPKRRGSVGRGNAGSSAWQFRQWSPALRAKPSRRDSVGRGNAENSTRQGIDGSKGADDLRSPADESTVLRAKPKRRASVRRCNVEGSTWQARDDSEEPEGNTKVQHGGSSSSDSKGTGWRELLVKALETQGPKPPRPTRRGNETADQQLVLDRVQQAVTKAAQQKEAPTSWKSTPKAHAQSLAAGKGEQKSGSGADADKVRGKAAHKGEALLNATAKPAPSAPKNKAPSSTLPVPKTQGARTIGKGKGKPSSGGTAVPAFGGLEPPPPPKRIKTEDQAKETERLPQFAKYSRPPLPRPKREVASDQEQEPVDELAALFASKRPRRPRLGDKVRVMGPGEFGVLGIIMKDEPQQAMPFWVDMEDGSNAWFKENWLQLVAEEVATKRNSSASAAVMAPAKGLTAAPPTTSPPTKGLTASPPAASPAAKGLTASPPAASPAAKGLTASPPAASPAAKGLTASPPAASPAAKGLTASLPAASVPTKSERPARRKATFEEVQATGASAKSLPIPRPSSWQGRKPSATQPAVSPPPQRLPSQPPLAASSAALPCGRDEGDAHKNVPLAGGEAQDKEQPRWLEEGLKTEDEEEARWYAGALQNEDGCEDAEALQEFETESMEASSAEQHGEIQPLEGDDNSATGACHTDGAVGATGLDVEGGICAERQRHQGQEQPEIWQGSIVEELLAMEAEEGQGMFRGGEGQDYEEMDLPIDVPMTWWAELPPGLDLGQPFCATTWEDKGIVCDWPDEVGTLGACATLGASAAASSAPPDPRLQLAPAPWAAYEQGPTQATL